MMTIRQRKSCRISGFRSRWQLCRRVEPHFLYHEFWDGKDEQWGPAGQATTYTSRRAAEEDLQRILARDKYKPIVIPFSTGRAYIRRTHSIQVRFPGVSDSVGCLFQGLTITRHADTRELLRGLCPAVTMHVAQVIGPDSLLYLVQNRLDINGLTRTELRMPTGELIEVWLTVERMGASVKSGDIRCYDGWDCRLWQAPNEPQLELPGMTIQDDYRRLRGIRANAVTVDDADFHVGPVFYERMGATIGHTRGLARADFV